MSTSLHLIQQHSKENSKLARLVRLVVFYEASLPGQHSKENSKLARRSRLILESFCRYNIQKKIARCFGFGEFGFVSRAFFSPRAYNIQKKIARRDCWRSVGGEATRPAHNIQKKIARKRRHAWARASSRSCQQHSKENSKCYSTQQEHCKLFCSFTTFKRK